MRISSLLFVLLISCNPVKQVLKDREKLNKVAEQVVRMGYCANDTTFITKSDTIVTHDTTTELQVEVFSSNDTVYKYETKYRDIVKKVIIRDTIKAVVIDNSRIKLLQADSAILSQKMTDYKQKADSRLNWLLLIAVAFGLYLFFKYKP